MKTSSPSYGSKEIKGEIFKEIDSHKEDEDFRYIILKVPNTKGKVHSEMNLEKKNLRNGQ